MTKMIAFRRFENKEGILNPIEFTKELPFEPKRAFLIREVPANAVRGNHAHKTCHQIFVAVSGAFHMTLAFPNCKETQEIYVCNPDFAWHVPPKIWVTVHNFSPGAVCLVLASHPYDLEDYINDYAAFQNVQG